MGAFDKGDIEKAVDLLIARLDAAAGDPDLERDDSEDGFEGHPDDGPGCPISDSGGPDDDAQGDLSWPEWQSRGRHKLTIAGVEMVTHSLDGWQLTDDDEEGDPREENGDEHDTGNAEDEGLTGSGLLYADTRVGCAVSDPGEHGGEWESGGQCMPFGIDQTKLVSEGEAFHDLNDIPLIRVPLPENDQ